MRFAEPLVKSFLYVQNRPMTKPRRGRPPIQNPATARVEFRCTPQEKSAYRRKAGKQGVSKWLKGLADK